MNPLLQRRYAPEEMQGLSKAEFAEMRELNLSRVEYDLHRLRVAHGDLCVGLIHLRRAQEFFKHHTPELALRLGVIGNDLAALVPSYQEFSAATRVRRGTR